MDASFETLIASYIKNNVGIATDFLSAVLCEHFAGKYPEKITAAVEICGGGNTADGCRLGTIPTWLFHGDKDTLVKMSESEKVFDAIKDCNPKAETQFTVVKGGTHGSVERLFHEDAIYDWMFSKVRE